jgi:nitroreductase
VRVDVETLIAALEPPALESPPPEPLGEPLPAPVPDDPLEAVAHAASLAPSGGNVQPWRFALTAGALDFELDRSRTSGMDVRFRGSYVALGAAVFNARVAAAAAGRLGPVVLFPEGASSDVVARLTFEGGNDPVLADLHHAVLERGTNRRRGVPAPIDLAVTARLAEAVRSEGAQLHLVSDHARLRECAEILGAAERIRFLTPALHAEMMSELRLLGEDVHTGIDVRTLEMGPGETATMGVLRRGDVMELLEKWDAGQVLGDNARTAVLSSSALAVVTVPDASAAAYVRGGGAVERLWVEAQRAGLGVQPVSPVFVFAVQQSDFDDLGGDRWADELRALSDRFRSLVDVPASTTLTLVVRLSHAPPATVRSLRRPLDAVLRRRP